MDTKTCSIVTSSSDDHWSQVYHKNHIFIVVEAERSLTSGTTIHLDAQQESNELEDDDISLERHLQTQEEKKDTEKNAHSIGRSFLESILTRLEEHVIEDLPDLKTIADELEKTIEPSTSLSFSIGYIKADTLNVVIRGGGALYLSRNNALALIGKQNATIAGKLKQGDKLFFLSHSMSNHLDVQSISALTTLDLDSFKEEIIARLHGQKDVVGASGVVVDINQVEPQIELQRSEEEIVSRPPEPKKKFEGHKALMLGISNVLQPVQVGLERIRERLTRDASARRWLTISIILVILLVSSVVFGFRKKQETDYAKRVAGVHDILTHEVEEAEALVDVNSIRARTLLAQSKKRIQPLLTDIPSDTPEGKEVQSILAKIESLQEKASHIYKTDSLTTFYDLSIVKPNGNGTDFSLVDGELVVLDASLQAIYTVDTDTKRGDIVAGGGDLSAGKMVSKTGEAYVILADNKLLATNGGNKAKVSRDGEDWVKVTDMATFGGSVYLTDAGRNELWKYPVSTSSIGEKTTWLPDDETHRFTDTTSIAIDGSVWILSGNDISKFDRGVKDPVVSLRGLEEPLSVHSALFTDEDSKYLYILEKDKNRVTVLTKKGAYEAQYKWTAPQNVTSVVALEKQKIILVLSKSGIYSIEMKHIKE